MGTPVFAIPVLSALINDGQEIVAVYTMPDKPVGRSNRVVISPLKQFAEEQEIRIFQPPKLQSQDLAQELTSISPDVVVVAAYGRLIPLKTSGLTHLDFLNVHPSLLPRYRGPSPVSTAILNGDKVTGVTVIKLDSGIDSGPILAYRETSIRPNDTTETLTNRLFRIGAALLVNILTQWVEGNVNAHPQNHSQAITTKLLNKKDGEIDWDLTALQIARQIRAFQPWPSSFTYWQDKLLKIIESHAIEFSKITTNCPGRVIQLPGGELAVGTSDGLLVMDSIQLEGRRIVLAKEFAKGYPGLIGTRLGK
jgi:methionyl-tRNA formyltransferase